MMKTYKYLFLLCLVWTMVFSAAAKECDAVSFAQTLGVGWNLGNNFDSNTNGISSETAWDNPACTPKLFASLRRAGFSSVRIPITWKGHIGAAPTYTLDSKWLNRIAEVIKYAHNEGLKVIINIHHDGYGNAADAPEDGTWLSMAHAARDENTNNEIKKKLGAVWHQIAYYFRSYSDWLMFETMNEIHDGKWGYGDNLTDGGHQYAILNEWNQISVDAIRTAGGQNTRRFIGIASYSAQPKAAMEHLVLPKDKAKSRLLVSVHMYDPWQYAGDPVYGEWGHTGRNVVPSGGMESDFVAILKALYDSLISRGIAVYVGEYGCVRRANEREEAFRQYYFEYTCKALRDYKMPVLVWDNGTTGTGNDAFGLMVHDDGRFIANGEQSIKSMVNAWNNNDTSYTLQSIYDRAPKFEQ